MLCLKKIADRTKNNLRKRLERNNIVDHIEIISAQNLIDTSLRKAQKELRKLRKII